MPRRARPAIEEGDEIILPRRENLLLRRLPSEELESLRSGLRPTAYERGDVLNEPGAAIDAVFFPESGLYSTTVTMQDGGTVETGGSGYEGLVGIPLFYGSDVSFSRVECEMPGKGQTMSAEVFRSELNKHSSLYNAVARLALALSHQTVQLAACNRLHDVEERLARWLLMTHDRAGTNRFPLTQQFVAFMLGVHRPSVTPVAGAFQKAGFIEYRRGIVTVLDRPSLEACACECYGIIADAFGDLRPRHDS